MFSYRQSTPIARINFEVSVALNETEAAIYWDAFDQDFPDKPKKHPFNVMKREFKKRYGTDHIQFYSYDRWADQSA